MMSTMQRRADVFIDLDSDPREGGPMLGDERTLLADFLRCQRLTLELKCSGLDPHALARRSVEPSTMSLLGLVRHLADVERGWIRERMGGEQSSPHYRTPAEPDRDFDGADADEELIAQAWRVWREEAANTDRFIAAAPDLDILGTDPWRGPVSLRWVLIHLIEEYARHNGHADLLRERIDGRIGQ
jgi:uncharacterized damage-inducible protein DinB